MLRTSPVPPTRLYRHRLFMKHLSAPPPPPPTATRHHPPQSVSTQRHPTCPRIVAIETVTEMCRELPAGGPQSSNGLSSAHTRILPTGRRVPTGGAYQSASESLALSAVPLPQVRGGSAGPVEAPLGGRFEVHPHPVGRFQRRLPCPRPSATPLSRLCSAARAPTDRIKTVVDEVGSKVLVKLRLL